MKKKHCIKCDKTKKASDFYQSPRSKDGFRTYCKSCCRENNKNYFKNLSPEKKKVMVEKAIENRKTATREQNLLWRKNWKIKERKLYPEKYYARKALQRAVYNNKVTRGKCLVCGTDENIHGHHDDYSKPLDVTWLCYYHHRQLHEGNISISN